MIREYVQMARWASYAVAMELNACDDSVLGEARRTDKDVRSEESANWLQLCAQ